MPSRSVYRLRVSWMRLLDAPRCANTDCPLLARGQDSLNLIQMLATMLRSLETATSRQVVYEARCSGLESSAQPAMSAGTTS